MEGGGSRVSRVDRKRARSDGRTLGEGERRADMKPRERLEEDHAETDALDGVEDSEPEPETGAEVGSDGASPRDVHCTRAKRVSDCVRTEERRATKERTGEGRRAPEHLAPARAAEADGKDAEDPRVRL